MELSRAAHRATRCRAHIDFMRQLPPDAAERRQRHDATDTFTATARGAVAAYDYDCSIYTSAARCHAALRAFITPMFTLMMCAARRCCF